jgi:four helix bundle protein
MTFEFEKLSVYQKALDFVDKVYQITNEFSRADGFEISSQFRRAALSIPLNIAEGTGRDTSGDRRRFYMTARSSVFECIPLIEICLRRNLITSEQANTLREHCEELSKMIYGLMSSLNHLD